MSNFNNHILSINYNEINNSKIISGNNFNNEKPYNYNNVLLSNSNNNIIENKNFYDILNPNIKNLIVEKNYNNKNINNSAMFQEIFINNINSPISKNNNNLSIQKYLSLNYNDFNCKLKNQTPETPYIYTQNYTILNTNENNFISTSIKHFENKSIEYENYLSDTNIKSYYKSPEFNTNIYNKNNNANNNISNEYNSGLIINQEKAIKTESPILKNEKNNYEINNSNKQYINEELIQCSTKNHNKNYINKEILNKNEIKKIINKKIEEKIIKKNNKSSLNFKNSKKTITRKSKDYKSLLEKYSKYQYYIIIDEKDNTESIGIKECSNCKTKVTPTWRRGKNDNLLCNACGLYEKQNNKSRPFEKMENGLTKVYKENITIKHVCANCNTNKAPTWRKGLNGQTLCNACGLFFKHHNIYKPS